MEDRWKKVATIKHGLEAQATRALASAHNLATQASDFGKAAGEAIGEKTGEAALRAKNMAIVASAELTGMAGRVLPVVSQKVDLASQHARQLSSKAGAEMKVFGERIASSGRSLEKNHEVIADRVETVSMAAGIASGAAAAVAIVAAPTGLAAAGVVLGITSAPLIVAAAPVLGIVATVTGVVSGGTYFYSKWKRNQPGQDA